MNKLPALLNCKIGRRYAHIAWVDGERIHTPNVPQFYINRKHYVLPKFLEELRRALPPVPQRTLRLR